ncbi:DUF4388 domain-containing protein [Mesoterricola sediminis]|nr:DUF4388 domain-containing protein [Mesoterricola sediminis]
MREAPLPDIIQLVSQGGKTGCFHVADEPRKARIYLKDGKIVHAVTNDCEGLDAIYEIALWLDGTYHFEEKDPGTEVTITKPNPSILMEMHKRMDEWRVISQKIPSLDLHPQSTLLPGETPSGVNPREARLLALVTGWYTVHELAEVLEKPVLTIAKDLYGLVMAGHVILKGVRGGRRPEVPVHEAPPQDLPAAPEPAPAPEPVPVSVSIPAPVPEPVPEPVPPPVAPAEPARVEIRPLPHPAPHPTARPVVQDPVKLAKLTNFTQRIVQASKAVLPPEHHDMVNKLQARANQQLMAGEGPEAVKNLALAVSRGAVDAGCDGETVKNLNAGLKALFAK